MSYVIETGVAPPPAIPSKGGRPRSEEHHVMSVMEVGQSFLITDYMRWLFVRGKLTKMRPRKFSMRKASGGWRVWRLE